MKTIVCLPTKNEVSSIQIMIDKITKRGYELIVSDENSTDGTIDIAKKNKIQVYQRDGTGKGCGVAKALEVANNLGYDYLILIDCDCTYSPSYFDEMVGYITENDMVVGRRSMSDICLSHRVVNILHTGLVNILFGAKLKDINSGLRILKVDKFYNLLNAKGFDIEAQVTCISLRKHYKIKEIPITYNKREGKSKIRALDTLRIIKRILTERFRKFV